MQIVHSTDATVEETLELAFRHLDDMERQARILPILEQFRSGRLPPEGLFQARREGRLVGALVSQLRPDGCLMFWRPTMRDNASSTALLEALQEYARRLRCPAVMALADRQQTSGKKDELLESGFDYLSELLYLVMMLEEFTPPDETQHPIPESGMEYRPQLEFEALETGRSEELQRMENVVKATYVASLDFPRLLGILEVPKVLLGYRQNGTFRPDLWFFVRESGRDIGSLILSDYGEDPMELTYMGLIESARSRGLGRQIVRFAAETARREGKVILLTAVDEKNPAALRSYLSQGFRVWDRKKVYVRLFEPDS